MQMQVNEGVTLCNPFGDGRDYSGGDLIDLSPEKAEQWEKWGWVTQTQGFRMPKPAIDVVIPDTALPEPAPEAIDATPIDPPRPHKRKGDDAS